MLWIPQKGRLRVQHNLGTAGDDTPGSIITTGAAASTKGSYVQVISSTNFDVYLIEISCQNYSLAANDSNLMIDVAVGAATEEIIIPNLMMGGAGGPGLPRATYMFPLYIPSGTAISVRGAGERVSTTFGCQVILWGGDGMPRFKVGRKVITYGVTTVPNGTTIVPGASGAAGTQTQITASTSEDHFALIPGFHPGVDTTKALRGYHCVIGVGAATEEELPPHIFQISTSEERTGPMPSLPVFADIPSGTRLAMRISNSGTNDSGNYNGCIYAVS